MFVAAVAVVVAGFVIVVESVPSPDVACSACCVRLGLGSLGWLPSVQSDCFRLLLLLLLLFDMMSQANP